MSDPKKLPPANWADPILSCTESRVFEKTLFADGTEEEKAMQKAGLALSRAIAQDRYNLGQGPVRRMLVLVGKGHNGGDALIAARHLSQRWDNCKVEVILTFDREKVAPTLKAPLDDLEADFHSLTKGDQSKKLLESLLRGGDYDLTIDGLLGMQCRPPLREPIRGLIQALNGVASHLGFRCAVDLPSGVGDEVDPGALRVDATYATGILKRPLLESMEFAGRLRYLDLGFFHQPYPHPEEECPWILKPDCLGFLRDLPSPLADKRANGRILALGGSRSMPGALLMTAEASLRAGCGLLTCASVAETRICGAARLPESMWMDLPGDPEGFIEGLGPAVEKISGGGFDVMVAGPGLGSKPGSRESLVQVIQKTSCPVVLDADALQPEILAAALEQTERPVVVTPHAGEWSRIFPDRDPNEEELRETTRQHPGLMVVLKGPVTRISAEGRIWASISGSPVLGRGGSGDILAGMIAARIGRERDFPLGAVLSAVHWHGKASEILEREKGSLTVRTTELFDHLPLRFIGMESRASSD